MWCEKRDQQCKARVNLVVVLHVYCRIYKKVESTIKIKMNVTYKRCRTYIYIEFMCISLFDFIKKECEMSMCVVFIFATM